MIAEKTADAIRGRKLTPFEPPTRIAAGLYSHNKVPSSPNAIYYRPPPPPPPPVQPLMYQPPPVAQMYPDLQRSLLESNNDNNTLNEQLNDDYIGNHHKFMLDSYAKSTMADNLIKKIGPVR